MRLLWMSDSPLACTGFGRVTREILGRLQQRPGYEVACIGWGYDGWPYDRRLIPYDICPSQGQVFGRDAVPRAIRSFRPDVLVCFCDLWMIDWIEELPGRETYRCVLYFPIDSGPFPPAWKPILRSADIAVTYSEFARQLAAAACPDIPIELIYHGVDTGVFKPLDRDEIRARHGLAGKFVVGCVARNQPRKNLPVLIKAFARFCEGKEDAFLYLHSDPNDIGWDLLDLLRRYGVDHRTCISRLASIWNGVDDTQLNEIYNLFDLMVLPTAGEGFGLPIVEAMAAGIPVVATDYSACVELVTGRGELIAVKEFTTAGRYNLEQALPDVEDLVAKLEGLYLDPDRRQAHRQSGLAFTRQLRWEPRIEEWVTILSS